MYISNSPEHIADFPLGKKTEHFFLFLNDISYRSIMDVFGRKENIFEKINWFLTYYYYLILSSEFFLFFIVR